MKTHDSNHSLRVGLFMVLLLAICVNVRSVNAPVTLKDAYKDHFLVGTAINRSMVTGATFRRSAEQNAKDVALIREQFNQISPENDLKWALVHPRQGADGYDFGPADVSLQLHRMTPHGTAAARFKAGLVRKKAQPGEFFLRFGSPGISFSSRADRHRLELAAVSSPSSALSTTSTVTTIAVATPVFRTATHDPHASESDK